MDSTAGAKKPVKPITKGSTTIPFLLLASRLVFFLTFQALIALQVNSWETSEKYWLLTATLTNIVSIALLFILFRRDGEHYLNIFTFKMAGLKKDIFIFSGLALLAVPIILLPGHFLGIMLWGDPDVPTEMMFRPIENWLVYILLVAFPVTIVFAELATYFRYIMPKLQNQLSAKWLAVLLPVIFLSIQHCTLPFIPDLNFMVFRALVYLPFAILIGISIYFRPSLFIYFAIFHGIMDFAAALMFLFETN